jgi:PAS domain S-box-containing protein
LQESEKRFRSYVEQAPDAMFIADEMGNLIEVNEAACRLTGYSKEEIAGMKLINISVDLENVQSQFRSLVESGSAFDEWDILTKSGDKRITSVKAVKLSEKRFLGFARDITERKMAENALVISENNFKSLFDLTTVGVAQVAPDGSFMRINKHFSDILGYSIDELSRMNFADITHPDDLSLDMEYAEECVAGIIDSYEIEKRYIHKNGDIIWARLSVKVVRDAKNVGVYAISVITDFTEKKKAEMALEENKAFLNEVETIAKIGGWELDVGSGNMVLEPEIRSIYEFNDSEDACIEEFLNFHTNSSRGLIEKQINCASENAEAFDIEAELITARGKHKCVRIIARPLIKNKAVEKFVGAIQDITLRKKAIQELEHNEQKYRTLFEQSNDAIIIHDTNGNIIDVNQMACDLFGYSQDELKQKSIIDLIAPEEIEKITAEFINIFTTGSSRQETKMIRPDGTVIYVDVNATLLKNQGNLVQAVGRDITDRIKAKNAMQNAKIEAETANRTKSEFLANMSHELRTPLNSIIGFSDIMLDGIVGELELKQEHYLQNISDSGKHLLDLINSILDISKIEAGKMDLYYEEINAERTAYEIISMMQTLTTKKNIVVDVHVPDGLPMINADRSKIKQVLYNLLGNAIKFTDNKGNITIHAAVENRKMQISVIDTGIGISHDDQKKLFKPFSQIDSSTSRKYAGTGLGLALVKDIVELHGGRIWVESEVGEGSNFTFEIPIDKVARTD